MRLTLLAAALALITSTPALAGADGVAERKFEVRGIVREALREGAIRIQHEDIPGFMPAMTMPFYATEADAGQLRPGDRVEFTFVVGERSRATNFRKVGGESPPAPPRAPAAATPRLRAGDAVPSFALVDQDGRAFTSDDLRGKLTLVTFIFTRCPVPEFCPALNQRFLEVQDWQRTARVDGLQLASVTIDPEYDTPAVLKPYAESLGADPRTWRFVTGDAAVIEPLLRRFAVRTERNAGRLDHSLATALIDPDGRVVEIWRGNGWKVSEVTERLRTLTASP